MGNYRKVNFCPDVTANCYIDKKIGVFVTAQKIFRYRPKKFRYRPKKISLPQKNVLMR